MKKIVMFPHPATEFRPVGYRNHPTRSACGWNMGRHCRRLMLNEGEYVDEQGVLQQGMIAFWGEWEANTLVTTLPPVTNPTSAHWVHETQGPTPCPIGNASVKDESDGECCQNTDPCVFGSTFKYAICRQLRKNRGRLVATQMQRMPPGSLIVFGGVVGGDFYLDTVFVVGDHVAYDGPDRTVPQTIRCSSQYRVLTLNQTCGNHTFYRGVNFTEGLGEPYSFVPGSVVDGGSRSLAPRARERCKLDLRALNQAAGNALFNARAFRNFTSMDANEATVRRVWNELIRQTRQHFVPAVHFDWPV